jgi:hypothetical protein
LTADRLDAWVTAVTSCETASMRTPELMRFCSAIDDAKLDVNASAEAW